MMQRQQAKRRPVAIVRRIVRAAALALPAWMISAWMILASGLAHADHPTRYEKRVSPGGVTFYHRHDPITPYASATFGWQVSTAQTGREGTRAVLGTLLFNGLYPSKPTDFFERLADLHATAAINVGETQVIAEAKAPAKELGAALDLVVRALQQGAPNAKTLRRTRNNAINGEAQANTRAETQVYRAGAVMLLGDHPITRNFNPKRLETISAAEITAWRKTAFTEGPLQIVVSGRLTEDEAGRLIDASFASWPKADPSPRTEPPLVVARAGTSVALATSGKQSVINLVAPTREMSGRDGQIAALAHGILGAGPSSRIWTAVRGSLGSTYGASSMLSQIARRQRTVTLSAAVDPAQTEVSIAAMRTAYATWYDAGITEAELRTQRERMITGVASNYRDPAAANRLLLPLLIQDRPLEEMTEYDAFLGSLTVEQVNTFIRERFPKPEDLMLVVGLPEGTTIAATCTAKAWTEVEKACPRP